MLAVALASLSHALETLANSKLKIRPRTVAVGPSLDITIYELAEPRELVELWMASGEDGLGAFGGGVATPQHDPFGVVLWPGAQLAAQLLQGNADALRGRTVLALGAGTGLEALAAAHLGAGKVLACDINPLALALLRHGAERAGLAERVETRTLDLFDEADALPAAEVLLCSDLLYNPELAHQVGRRCGEALTAAEERESKLSLLVTDSQRFQGGGDGFSRGLQSRLPSDAAREAAEAALGWQATHLEQFTGSGILVDGDQTYDIDARFISRWPATPLVGASASVV